MKNVIQIKIGITINVGVNVKTIIYEKKIKFGVQLHAVAKMVNVYQVLLTIHLLHVMKL